MKVITRQPDYDELFFCPDCGKERKIVLEKDDPDNAEPNLVTCLVCLEIIAEIQR